MLYFILLPNTADLGTDEKAAVKGVIYNEEKPYLGLLGKWTAVLGGRGGAVNRGAVLGGRLYILPPGTASSVYLCNVAHILHTNHPQLELLK